MALRQTYGNDDATDAIQKVAPGDQIDAYGLHNWRGGAIRDISQRITINAAEPAIGCYLGDLQLPLEIQGTWQADTATFFDGFRAKSFTDLYIGSTFEAIGSDLTQGSGVSLGGTGRVEINGGKIHGFLTGIALNGLLHQGEFRAFIRNYLIYGVGNDGINLFGFTEAEVTDGVMHSFLGPFGGRHPDALQTRTWNLLPGVSPPTYYPTMIPNGSLIVARNNWENLVGQGAQIGNDEIMHPAYSSVLVEGNRIIAGAVHGVSSDSAVLTRIGNNHVSTAPGSDYASTILSVGHTVLQRGGNVVDDYVLPNGHLQKGSVDVLPWPIDNLNHFLVSIAP